MFCLELLVWETLFPGVEKEIPEEAFSLRWEGQHQWGGGACPWTSAR